MIDWLVMATAGFVAFVVSTVAGGGGALLLVPVVSFYLGAQAVAPVVSLGEMINRPVRLALFWQHIDWTVAKYYVPGGIVGALKLEDVIASPMNKCRSSRYTPARTDHLTWPRNIRATRVLTPYRNWIWIARTSSFTVVICSLNRRPSSSVPCAFRISLGFGCPPPPSSGGSGAGCSVSLK